MADEGDLSVQAEAEALEVAMANHQARLNKPTLPATGFCHYCDEPVATEHRFCEGEECRDDYEYEQHRKHARRI